MTIIIIIITVLNCNIFFFSELGVMTSLVRYLYLATRLLRQQVNL